MRDPLDEKLKQITVPSGLTVHTTDGKDSYMPRIKLDDIAIKQIKAIFAELDYRQVPRHKQVQSVEEAMNIYEERIPIMTGREWYKKLAKHLNIYNWTQDEKDSILQAAFEVAEGMDI